MGSMLGVATLQGLRRPRSVCWYVVVNIYMLSLHVLARATVWGALVLGQVESVTAAHLLSMIVATISNMTELQLQNDTSLQPHRTLMPIQLLWLLYLVGKVKSGIHLYHLRQKQRWCSLSWWYITQPVSQRYSAFRKDKHPDPQPQRLLFFWQTSSNQMSSQFCSSV